LPFSARTRWNLQPTRYALAVEHLRASGKPCIDLTVSNPTACGLDCDPDGILREISRPESLRYHPDPRGLPAARSAIADYYAQVSGARIPIENIVLTASTSEAYSFLFRLHCDPGAQVLVPQPSYPLFDFLADLDDVRLVPYPLFYDHGWHIDVAALESRITPEARALMVVHPNNPTGHCTGAQERAALEDICRRHQLALIVDEVFLDYGLESPVVSFAAGDHPALTYVLSGLSKIAALPQMKAAWIAAFGPQEELAQATARLEVIADTFLSVGAPVQHGLPGILANRSTIQRNILSRVRENLAALDLALASAPSVSRLPVQAGWCAILRVPALRSGEDLAIHLVEEHGVIVQPGYFYGMEGDGWLVISLLAPAPDFLSGMNRLLHAFR
jgi:alanine-synthesizing transaminase